MVSIARSKALDDDTRQASLEFLTLLIENSPNMIRSLPTSVLLTPLLQILFSILVEIDPDPAHTWEQDETEPDEAEPSMFNYTLGVLARVSQAIRGRVFLPPLYALIDRSMHNADWRYRHAVMYTLCQVGEIVTDETQRRQIAHYVITSFQDAHPRVRYASVRCLGQLATDFQPFLQHELSVSALTAIFSLLHADQPVRVRFITAAALINFVDGADPAVLQPVLGDMLHALLDALPSSPILVQKQVRVSRGSHIDPRGHRVDRGLRGRGAGAVLPRGYAGDQAAVHAAVGGGGAAGRQHGAVVVPVDGAGVHHVRGRGGGGAAVPAGRAGRAGSDVPRGNGRGGGVLGDEERDDERRETEKL